MNFSDLAKHLATLLFEHDTVVLPGLGAFQTQSSTASVDYAGGSVTPPSKSLIFNENLGTDDGLLMQQIATTQGISFEEASATIEAIVAQIQVLLNQREIVALPGIGRLYKNYVQKVQFLPDAQNFSRENYGLPPLQFSPIARSREVQDAVPSAAPSITSSVAATPVVPIKTTPTPPPSALPTYEKAPSSGFPIGRTLLVLTLLGISGGLGYWLWQRQKAKVAF
jgi:nucleoid DNA-binding protein